MSDRTDRVLDVIDAGLGSSFEQSYAAVRPDLCTRCVVRKPAVDSDFCGACRAFLLGDGPDPGRGLQWSDLEDGVPYVTSSTGLTVPAQVDCYELFLEEFSQETVYGRVDLPMVSAPRGGIRYVSPPGWSPPSNTYVFASGTVRGDAVRAVGGGCVASTNDEGSR